MRKLTTLALVLTLSLAVPVATFAAPAPQKPKTSNVREDRGPSDGDVISRVLRVIRAYLHLVSNEQPITPTP